MAVELWHFKSDLLASGVPSGQILPGGYTRSCCFGDSTKVFLGCWAFTSSVSLEYDSDVDGTDPETARWSQSITVMNRAGNEDEVTEAHGNASI